MTARASAKPSIDRVLAGCRGFTAFDFAELAIAATVHAGLSGHTIAKLSHHLLGALLDGAKRSQVRRIAGARGRR